MIPDKNKTIKIRSYGDVVRSRILELICKDLEIDYVPNEETERCKEVKQK